MMGSGQELASEKFRQQLELRSSGRATFSKADNSDALRRPVHHQSRGIFACTGIKERHQMSSKRVVGAVQHKSYARNLGLLLYICVNHMNRLLRCAKENLRPVSLRKF